MIFDARALYAFFVRDVAGHWAAIGQVELLTPTEQLVVSPFVVAELEGVVRERFGLEGWLAVLEQLASAAWTIAPVDAEHVRAMRDRVAVGQTLARASVAVLVEGDS